MVLIDDIVIGLSAAIATSSLIVLAAFLSRYRTVVKEATKSAELAKNVWDSMNTRLTTQDTRIIDLMARLDVYSVRQKPSITTSPKKVTIISRESSQGQTPPKPLERKEQISTQVEQLGKHTNDTEVTILRALMEGPKSSNQIREVIKVTREHNGRLLKELFERGLVTRNDQNKPFLYEISETGRRLLSQS